MTFVTTMDHKKLTIQMEADRYLTIFKQRRERKKCILISIALVAGAKKKDPILSRYLADVYVFVSKKIV